MLAGRVTSYKLKFHTTVALSSTEVEFTTTVEVEKTIIYLHSILKELGYPHKDNAGALYMASAELPTKWTCHIDTKTFDIQQWFSDNHMTMK